MLRIQDRTWRCLVVRSCTMYRWSWHRLGPRHMTLKAEVCRHLSVAVALVSVSSILAPRLCQEGAQPDQPEVGQHEPGCGRVSRQTVDGCFRLAEVAVRAATQQRL